MTTAVANAPATGAGVANSQGATPADMNPGETNVGNQPPVVNNAPPAATTPVEQQQAAQDQQQAKPQQTAEQEAAAAEAAKVAAQPIDFVQGNPQEVATVNAAIDLMRQAGLTKADGKAIFGRAFETGDLADVNRAALVQKVGEQKAALILAGIAEYNANVGNTRRETVKAVWETMGGEENWKAVRSWARAKEAVDPEFAKELNEYRSMIDMGGKTAKYAAQELRKLYEADPKNSSLARTIVQGDGTVARVENPITTRAEYVELLKKAYNKGDMAAVAQINARRAAGRAIAVR